MLNTEKIKNKIFIFLFMTAIYAPLIGSFFKLEVTSDEAISSSELRQPAKFPILSRNPLKYVRSLESYYNDHFSFRKNMIQFYSIAKVLWLGESSSSNVIVGNNNWFFLSKAGGQDELNYYRSTNPFTPQEIVQWKLALEKRNNWLASQGIHYLLVIAPNKTTVYSEFLPKSINRVRQESRLDQLITYMRENSTVKILDLRDSFRSAKEKELIYHPKDTHWNDLGAFIAYQQIIKTLKIWYPNLNPLSKSNFKIESTYGNSDLINIVGLTDVIKDKRLTLTLRGKRLAFQTDPQINKPDLPIQQRPVATELGNHNLPKAVMFHDSFADSLKPFLSENFKRIVYLWQDEFDRKIVQKERPEIVIQEMVERKLMDILPE